MSMEVRFYLSYDITISLKSHFWCEDIKIVSLWMHCCYEASLHNIRHIDPSLVLVEPRKTLPYITERLLMRRKESNQTKQKKKKHNISKYVNH